MVKREHPVDSIINLTPRLKSEGGIIISDAERPYREFRVHVSVVREAGAVGSEVHVAHTTHTTHTTHATHAAHSTHAAAHVGASASLSCWLGLFGNHGLRG